MFVLGAVALLAMVFAFVYWYCGADVLAEIEADEEEL